MRVERCYKCENLKFIMGRPEFTSDLPVIEGYECKESGVKVSHKQGEGELVKSCPLLPLRNQLDPEQVAKLLGRVERLQKSLFDYMVDDPVNAFGVSKEFDKIIDLVVSL